MNQMISANRAVLIAALGALNPDAAVKLSAKYGCSCDGSSAGPANCATPAIPPGFTARDVVYDSCNGVITINARLTTDRGVKGAFQRVKSIGKSFGAALSSGTSTIAAGTLISAGAWISARGAMMKIYPRAGISVTGEVGITSTGRLLTEGLGTAAGNTVLPEFIVEIPDPSKMSYVAWMFVNADGLPDEHIISRAGNVGTTTDVLGVPAHGIAVSTSPTMGSDGRVDILDNRDSRTAFMAALFDSIVS